VRNDPGVAQIEHVQLAKACEAIFQTQFPTIHGMLDTLNKEDRDRDELLEEIEALKALLAQYTIKGEL
jgi:Asp-tRNA(Asn)/Glu-tRNA(Gln) amidotransferase C subunit